MIVDLIRHGMTEYNETNRYQGLRDIPLSELGKRQLHRADIMMEAVYVSPLSRARQTARILFPEAELIPVEGLQEMDFGVFEGHNYMEMEYEPNYRDWVEGGCVGRCPGGESMKEFQERTCRVFKMLVENALRRGDERLVIVAHGGTQRAALERFALPHKSYFEWNTRPGTGVQLTTEPWELGVRNAQKLLNVVGEIDYTKG